MIKQRQCGSCGTIGMERAIRGVKRDFQGQMLTIPAVDGWHCLNCEEVEFVNSEEAERFFAAAQASQEEALRQQAEAIRAIRSRLGLTQKQAAELLGGG
ncbi:MAG: type II TA system antitoxin MqsA family protein, partial [Methylococcaceae bacterium]